MKKVYVWKVLSEDGLLKDHKEVGPYYDRESFYDEYESEEDAVEAYQKFNKRYNYSVESEMVLLTIYKIDRDYDNE